jgi:competence ComEA-like helix-hairpin-helix protein
MKTIEKTFYKFALICVFVVPALGLTGCPRWKPQDPPASGVNPVPQELKGSTNVQSASSQLPSKGAALPSASPSSLPSPKASQAPVASSSEKGGQKSSSKASVVPVQLPVNINTATVEELASVKGLGKKKAGLIVASRPYKTLEDLLKVKGFGKKTFEKLKPSLKVTD